jgi:hypothetical protein
MILNLRQGRISLAAIMAAAMLMRASRQRKHIDGRRRKDYAE